MPEDDERTEGEDLFEDLDKFFAPIQDVDWPEPKKAGGPPANGRTSPRSRPPRRRRKPPKRAQLPGGVRDHDRGQARSARAPGRGAWGGRGGRRPVRRRVAADLRRLHRGARRGRVRGPGETEEGVGSYLFETDEEDEARGEEGEAEPLPRPQQRYVERPGRSPAEDEVIREEAPDLEAVEAAADHFESVRDEVGWRPRPPLRPTEQVAIAGAARRDESAEEAARTGSAARASADPAGRPTAMEVGGEREEAAERNVPTAFLTGIVLRRSRSARSCSGPGRSRSSRASWSCSRRASSTSRCRSVTTSRPPRSAWSPARSCSAPATTEARTRCSPLWRCRCSARSCGS